MPCFESDTAYSAFLEVMRAHYHRSRMLLEEAAVYPGQPPMLYALHKKNGQKQNELADKLGVKPATITVMLNRMEKQGLVEREQDPEDHRVSRVFLTQQGKKVFNDVDRIIKGIEKECFTGFTDMEKVLLRRLLMQMHENLNKACNNN